MILSAGWESGRGGSTVAKHEWKGLQKMAGGLEDWLEKNKQEQREGASRRGGPRRHVPGAFDEDDEDEEEE